MPEFAPGRVGPRIGEYLIEAELGRGGTATVFQVSSASKKQRFALKLLHSDCTESVMKRFHRECMNTAIAKHRYIAAVLDVGTYEGRPFLVTELIDGKPLDLKMPIRLVVAILARAAEALDSVHRQGVVHRDIKPSNILVDGGLQPHIVDFGLAQLITSNSVALTRRGLAAGTPAYMAPEQVCGWKDLIGPATDIYAFGAMLYEALAGKAAHTGKHITAVVKSIRTTDPVPPPGPKQLVAICMKAMARDLSRRHARASALADELNLWLHAEAETKVTRKRTRE